MGVLGEELVVEGVVVELDEEHAARPSATTASPAAATWRLRRRCISGTPYRVYRVSGRNGQPGPQPS
jgi:hypothetical protein